MTLVPLSGCDAPIVDRRCATCGRPALLDAYCCQGGASAGYQAAGFCTTGIDIDEQPRYPWHFIRADAVAFIVEHGYRFAATHTSPPCQRYSACQRIQGRPHPDLIGPTRAALELTGRPWVIENVEDARHELRSPITLCGQAFDLSTYRHRLFEASFPIPVHPHLQHAATTVKMGRALVPGDFYHAVGNFSGVGYVRDDLGVPWMNRDGIRECIPPAFAEFVGSALLAHLAENVAA